MSIVADFSVPAASLCLGDTLAAVPSATIELDRLVAHSPTYVMPFIWLINADQQAFEAAVADDASVKDATNTDSFGSSHLYQISWTDIVSDRLELILDHEGVILEARGSGDAWRLWVRFGTRDHFTEFKRHFDQYGNVTLHAMTNQQTPGGIHYGVSNKQRDALLAAYDQGYYDVPRTASGKDIAEQLDVSQQAVSNRLRRGVHTLIENTLGRHRD